LPDSISIPTDLLAETKAALDAALSLASDSPEAYGKVAKVRAKLDEAISEIPVNDTKKSDILTRSELKKVRDELLTLARRIEKVERAA
jgi:hypothetical protein